MGFRVTGERSAVNDGSMMMSARPATQAAVVEQKPMLCTTRYRLDANGGRAANNGAY